MLKGFLVAFGLLALCAWVFSNSASFQSCMQQHQQNTTAHTSQNGIASFGIGFGIYRDCLGSYVHDNREDLLTVFTIVLAFSAILLWVATRDLASEAAESSRRELRAYVSAGHPKFEKPDPDTIAVPVENGGRTPAYNVRGWLNVYWLNGADSVLPDNFKFPDQEESGNFPVYRSIAVLHPGKNIPFTFLNDLDPIRRCRKKEVAVFIYGHIDYIDVFDKPQTTKFCYQYFPVEVGIGHSLVVYDEHNEAS